MRRPFFKLKDYSTDADGITGINGQDIPDGQEYNNAIQRQRKTLFAFSFFLPISRTIHLIPWCISRAFSAGYSILQKRKWRTSPC